jgi:hypothetical protein
MINEIFTDEERKLLEAYLTSTKVNEKAVEKLIEAIKDKKSLFEDIFLYLQVRKTITS